MRPLAKRQRSSSRLRAGYGRVPNSASVVARREGEDVTPHVQPRPKSCSGAMYARCPKTAPAIVSGSGPAAAKPGAASRRYGSRNAGPHSARVKPKSLTFRPTIAGHQHVLRLEVAMHETRRVSSREPFGGLAEDPCDFLEAP